MIHGVSEVTREKQSNTDNREGNDSMTPEEFDEAARKRLDAMRENGPRFDWRHAISFGHVLVALVAFLVVAIVAVMVA